MKKSRFFGKHQEWITGRLASDGPDAHPSDLPVKKEGNAKFTQAAFHLMSLRRAQAHNTDDLERASAQKQLQAKAMTLPHIERSYMLLWFFSFSPTGEPDDIRG